MSFLAPSFCFRIQRIGLLMLMLLFAAGGVSAQTCAAPGKDAPGTVAGIVNTYYQGNGNLAIAATALTLGAASGAARTVTTGDMLLLIQMQGADIATSDDELYGAGIGTPGNQPDTSLSQANGYTALNLTGGYEYVRVATAVGSAITFTPPLSNAYQQNIAAQPRRTYQVIRVPQYPSITVNGAVPVVPLAWSGLVGGVTAMDVAGSLTFTGAGPHIDASRLGFRGGAQGVPDSIFPGPGPSYLSTATADGGSKGEGIAGTPQYVSNSTAGSYNAGTRFSDPVGGFLDNGAGNLGYTNGDFMRGAPGNAGGGGNSHNASGGGGGNGGTGGNGSQTYNGDGLRDLGGFGGSRTPQNGVLLPTRIFMGGGGSGSLNNDSGNRAEGGNGGGIIMLRAGSISGAGLLSSDGQRGWDSDASNDPGGGGGAGGSLLIIAGSGHGNITVQARGGNGSDSNMTTSSLPSAPPNGNQGACCNGEREGPGGGGGGGAVYANSTLSSLSLGGGINGLSREDKAAGFSGNMLAASGNTGTSLQTIASSAIVGVRGGYECLPVLTVSKRTSTPALTVPPDTSGTYIINISNAATSSGFAYGIGITDVLLSPFRLTGTTAILAYSAGASGPVSPVATTGISTVVIGTAGHPTNGFTLQPGANMTVTFKVGLNGATAGTYQNPAIINFTDPTRTSGGNATGAINSSVVTPGGSNAIAGTIPGSNYASGSNTQEDIVIAGAAGTTADLALVKTGPAAAEVGQAVQYILTLTNSGPSNVTGSVSISDVVPAGIGTVTWACSLVSGTADCDTASGGTGASSSGNSVNLTRISINSGGQLSIQINGTAASAGNITNTATVSLPAGYTDPTPSNNTGIVTTTITVPTADLSAAKTNGLSSVFSGGATAYTISIANAGPSAANNAVVTDTAATGLTLQSVSCAAASGAVCPAGLTTATFQAGALIPTFPAGSTLTFTANALVTAASGTVTNTVSVTAPAGLTEINAANNSAADSDAVTVAAARVTSSAQICPAGSTEQLTNLLTNSDFSNTTVSVGALVTQYPVNTNVPDTGVGPQTGARNYGVGAAVQAPFPGDGARSVAGAGNWLYNKGNNTGADYRFWSQPVSGLTAGTTYEWIYYGSNALAAGSAATDLPTIEFRLLSGTTTFTLASNSFPNEGAGTSDTWTLRQSTFTAALTGVTLQLFDTAANTNGDAFASTQILLRECKPNTDPFVTKSDSTSTVSTFGTTGYVVTVGNNGLGPADGIVVKDLAATGLNKTAISCAAFGTDASCPTSSTVAGVEGSGLTIPSLPANTTVIFTITASVTALNGTVTNTVSLQLPGGMTDTNLANNTASDADAVKGVANITISKTNGVGAVTAGGTTAYTLTVANLGPSNASGSVVSDPAAPGLSCTAAASCTASGGALCAASIPAATLKSGYIIPALPSGGQVVLLVTCGVTATGQ